MNRGSLHTRSFRHIHLLVQLCKWVSRSFNKRVQGDWDGNKQQPIRFTDMHVCPQELFACVLKLHKSTELEMFLFCLWNEFTVSIIHLSVFYFSAYKTELELKLKLLENLGQILGE